VEGGAAWERVDYAASTTMIGTAYRAPDTRDGWCRGRAQTCDRRNAPLVPEGVLEFFEAFRLAKRDGASLDDFREAMEEAELDEIYFAWRNGGQAQ